MERNPELNFLDVRALETARNLKVRARPRPRYSAGRARSRAHRAELSLLLSRRVATRAPGDWERKARN